MRVFAPLRSASACTVRRIAGSVRIRRVSVAIDEWAVRSRRGWEENEARRTENAAAELVFRVPSLVLESGEGEDLREDRQVGGEGGERGEVAVV